MKFEKSGRAGVARRKAEEELTRNKDEASISRSSCDFLSECRVTIHIITPPNRLKGEREGGRGGMVDTAN